MIQITPQMRARGKADPSIYGVSNSGRQGFPDLRRLSGEPSGHRQQEAGISRIQLGKRVGPRDSGRRESRQEERSADRRVGFSRTSGGRSHQLCDSSQDPNSDVKRPIRPAISIETDAKPLFDLLGTPAKDKVQKVYDSDHF